MREVEQRCAIQNPRKRECAHSTVISLTCQPLMIGDRWVKLARLGNLRSESSAGSSQSQKTRLDGRELRAQRNPTVKIEL